MKCETIRKMLETGEDAPELRDHLRNCADCLVLAISREPSILFVTMGNSEIEPPGGVDPFVSDVMNEVRVREKERSLEHREHPVRVAWWWSAAAAIFILVTTWLAIQPNYRPDVTTPDARTAVAAVEASGDDRPEPELTRPVVDEYDRSEATIVELPSETADELKIVMIFDESLPQDL